LHGDNLAEQAYQRQTEIRPVTCLHAGEPFAKDLPETFQKKDSISRSKGFNSY